MSKKLLASIAILAALVALPVLAMNVSADPVANTPCVCCGEGCTCVDCGCDANSCACDSGGECACSEQCEAACCSVAACCDKDE